MDFSDQNEQEESYKRASKEVKKLKGFYSHLGVFIVINTMIISVNMFYTNSPESIFRLQNFSTLFFWGIGLIAHASSVFLPYLKFGKKWEDEKIKKIMDRDKQNKF